MANNATGQSSYGFLSNAVLETEEQSGSVEGASLLGFDSKEADDERGSHRVAASLNFGLPSGISWSGGAIADGIISVAAKESRALIQASPGGLLEARGSSDTMIGLELGKRTYFQLPGGVGGVAARQEASQAPPKKPRVAGQAPKCQVEGCKADLTSSKDAKDYHRRHKVCAIHSKAPRAMVLGKEQRFCQQCSRFHGLAEFDEGKRSCRRRLDGHNRRRRKPQPDALGLNARFLPAFQDSTRLGHLLADRSSFLPNVRSPALWNDVNALNYGPPKGPWTTRTAAYDDPSLFQGSMPAGAGMERQLFSGFHHPSDRSTLFSPQSPKGMIPVSSDVVGGPKTTHRYFQESADPLRCQNLSLASSSSAGAGVVLSGLEAMPVGQGFARVSDSGCALSLQSTMQLLSSAQASVARSSMDMTSHSTMMMTDQSLHGSLIPMAQPLVGQQHQQFEWGHDDKLLSAASSLHNLSSVATTDYHHVGSNPINKDHFEGHYAHGINGVGEGYDSLPLYSMVHGGEVRFAQDVKPTIDLMQVASSSHGRTTQPLASSESFDSEMSHFGDLQGLRAYGSSIFSSQQM